MTEPTIYVSGEYHSIMNGERYAAQNFLEFELVEIEIEYRIKK